MPLDPRARRFLDMIGAGGTRAVPASIEEQRRAFALLMQNAGTPAPPGVASRDITVPGAAGVLPARLYDPAEGQGEALPGLVFFHGGGFTAGSLDTHHAVCAGLAAASGCRIVAAGYRLAPEHPFPAAVEDALAATNAVFARAAALGIDAGRLAVGGDSVGANLAATVARENRQAFRAQLLICPVLDARGEGASHHLFAEGHFLEGATMERDLAAYAGGAVLDRGDPRLSPLHAADLSGLPPAIVETAEYDPVRDDGAAYAERLAQAGVPVRYTCHPGMIHLFYAFGRLIPGGPIALKAAGGRLAEVLG